MEKTFGNFTFIETPIKGVYVIEVKKFGDSRGYFMETYKKEDFDIVKVMNNMDAAFDFADKLNREVEEHSPNFAPAKGYFNENDIKNVVAEAVKRVLTEKAVSKAQQRFFGMVHAYQKGELKDASPEIEKVADEMSKKDVKDFASTKLKGLPKHVKKSVNESEGEQYVPEYVWVDSRVKGFGGWYNGQNTTMSLDELQAGLDSYNACVYYKENFYNNVADVPFKPGYSQLSSFGMPMYGPNTTIKEAPRVTVVPKGTTIDDSYYGKHFIFPKEENIPESEPLNENANIGEDPKAVCARLAMRALDNLNREQKVELFKNVMSALGTEDMVLVRNIYGLVCRGECENLDIINKLTPMLETFIENVYGPDEEPENDENFEDDNFDYESLGAYTVNEEHGKRHNGPKDYMSAIRKGNRDAEMEKMGGGFKQRNKVHGMRNSYPGKKVKDSEFDCMDENMVKLKAMIKESVRKVLNEDAYGDEMVRLQNEHAQREKSAMEICKNLGYTHFWHYGYLLCVELQSTDELSKVSHEEVWRRKEEIEKALKRGLGSDCRVDYEIRGMVDDKNCISSYAKLYV